MRLLPGSIPTLFLKYPVADVHQAEDEVEVEVCQAEVEDSVEVRQIEVADSVEVCQAEVEESVEVRQIEVADSVEVCQAEVEESVEVRQIEAADPVKVCQIGLIEKYNNCMKKIHKLEKKLAQAKSASRKQKKQLEKKLAQAKSASKKRKKLAKKRKKEITKDFLKEIGHSDMSIKHILDPLCSFHRNHSQEDICDALIIKSMSNRTYEYLRKNKILPLASSSTLSKWLTELDCRPGMENSFFCILKKKFQDAQEWERQAILSFDEVDVKKRFEYDYINKRVYGNHKKLQTVMVRGLIGPWKQTVFFDFDTVMTKDLIKELILKCSEAGLCIRGISFDMGNPTFLKQLGVLRGLHHYMTNPADQSSRIYLFPDAPHLLKRLR